MNSEALKFSKRVAHEGIFVRPRLSVWQNRRSITLRNIQGLKNVCENDSVMCNRDFKISKLAKSRRLLSGCKLAIKNLSYRTVYGNFVPRPNIERFKNEMEEFKGKLEVERDKVLAQYDEILEELKEEVREMAKFVWASEYQHEGDPHPRFVDSFVSDYFEKFYSPEEARQRFKFEIYPVCPLVPEKSPYGLIVDPKENNHQVYTRVYKELLNRRKALVSLTIEVEEGLRESRLKNNASRIGLICQRMSGKLQKYLWAIFYKEEDQKLLDLLVELRNLIIISDETRTVEAVIGLTTEIREHIINHDLFRTGIEIEQ